SPGTVTDPAMLDDREPVHLLAIAPTRSARLGLAWSDLSAGRLLLLELEDAAALEPELARIGAAEVLVPDDERGEQLIEHHRLRCPRRLPPFVFDPVDAERRWREHLGVATLEGFGIASTGPSLGAAGALLHYVEQSKPDYVAGLRTIERFRRDETLLLDPAALRALEVVETVRHRRREGSLLQAVDRTASAMGARRLREWLLAPLRERTAITARHEAVEALLQTPLRLERLRAALRECPDLERLAARVAARRAGPRDLAALRSALAQLPALRENLDGLAPPRLAALREQLAPLPELLERLERELTDTPPLRVSDGGVIREGVDPELDAARTVRRDAHRLLAEMQAREIEATGIPSLKIAHNNVFGYYISVTNTHRDKVPAHYVRKQTLKNAERYVTEELKALEQRIERAEQEAAEREAQRFAALREACEQRSAELAAIARAAAELDVLAGFAALALERGYVRPELEDSNVLEIEAGRHPVIEQTLDGEPFVPNDIALGGEHRPIVAVITGPNMAGKSTFCRQVALIVLLAQTGCFVPAERARVGLVDRIYCRLGSADEIMRGLSTFMVEMVETAAILRGATDRSLVVLDEVGRGTSTYDGVSLAFAVTEYLSETIGCRSLFATHYHELCELARHDPRVVNLNVAVREWGERIVFLHKIEPGSADRSYGLHVARLAGVPEAVVQRAEQRLRELEDGRRTSGGASRQRERRTARQPSLFAPPEQRLRMALQALDLDQLTPLQALNWLQGWKRRLDNATNAS
ncbi:MAG: DNA mismatch repair protein MutS, partial [Planctomycetota bacterium]